MLSRTPLVQMRRSVLAFQFERYIEQNHRKILPDTPTIFVQFASREQ